MRAAAREYAGGKDAACSASLAALILASTAVCWRPTRGGFPLTGNDTRYPPLAAAASVAAAVAAMATAVVVSAAVAVAVSVMAVVAAVSVVVSVVASVSSAAAVSSAEISSPSSPPPSSSPGLVVVAAFSPLSAAVDDNDAPSKPSAREGLSLVACHSRHRTHFEDVKTSLPGAVCVRCVRAVCRGD